MSIIKHFLISWNAEKAASKYAQELNAKYYNWLDYPVNFISQNQYAAKLIDDFKTVTNSQNIYEVRINDTDIILSPNNGEKEIILAYSDYGLCNVSRHIVFLKFTLICAIFNLMPGYRLKATHIQYDKEWSTYIFDSPADFAAACKKYYYYRSQLLPDNSLLFKESLYFSSGLVSHTYYEVRFCTPCEDQWNYFVLFQQKESPDKEVTSSNLSSWF